MYKSLVWCGHAHHPAAAATADTDSNIWEEQSRNTYSAVECRNAF